MHEDETIEFLGRMYQGMKASSARGAPGSPGDGSVPLMVAIEDAEGRIDASGEAGWAFLIWAEGTDTLQAGLEQVRAQALGGRGVGLVAVLADAYTTLVSREEYEAEEYAGLTPSQRFEAGDMSVTECLQITVLRADGSGMTRTIRYTLDDEGLPVFAEPEDLDGPVGGRVPEAMAVLVRP